MDTGIVGLETLIYSSPYVSRCVLLLPRIVEATFLDDFINYTLVSGLCDRYGCRRDLKLAQKSPPKDVYQPDDSFKEIAIRPNGDIF